MTKAEFEAMLERAASIYDLPIDDKLRSVFAGYVHHISNDKNTFTLFDLAIALHKSVSNELTWNIDQECKKKAMAQTIKEANEIKDNVTPLKDA